MEQQALALSQAGLAGLMAAQIYLMYRLAKKIGGFLRNVREEPPVVTLGTLVVGQQAPTFTATDQSGRNYDAADWRGRIVMRLFTLPTCPICRTIVPRLQEIRDRFPDVDVLLVTSDEGGEEAAAGFADEAVLIHSTSIRRLHGITSVPTLVFVNRENRVIAKERVTSFDDLMKRVEVYREQA